MQSDPGVPNPQIESAMVVDYVAVDVVQEDLHIGVCDLVPAVPRPEIHPRLSVYVHRAFACNTNSFALLY